MTKYCAPFSVKAVDEILEHIEGLGPPRIEVDQPTLVEILKEFRSLLHAKYAPLQTQLDPAPPEQPKDQPGEPA